MDCAIPSLDITPFLAESGHDDAGVDALVEQTVAACQRLGFFRIRGHGIPADVIYGALRCSYDFFARDPGEKLRHAKHTPLGPGYVPFEERSDSQKEEFDVGPEHPDPSRFPPNRLPVGPGGFGPAILRYYAELARVETALLRLLAAALAKCSGTALAPDHLLRARGRHGALLRINHYPATGRRHGPEVLRNGPHVDWSSITILLQDREGLEVQDGETWRSVPVDPYGLVVNLGKQVHRISDGLFAASMHRVDARDCTEARLSIAYFGAEAIDPTDGITIAPIVRPGIAPRFEPVEIREMIGRLADAHRSKVIGGPLTDAAAPRPVPGRRGY